MKNYNKPVLVTFSMATQECVAASVFEDSFNQQLDIGDEYIFSYDMSSIVPVEE